LYQYLIHTEAYDIDILLYRI